MSISINFRSLYIADPGFLFWKRDLTGADGWTVACRTAAQGDKTLLEDLKAGIRIPSFLTLMLEGFPSDCMDRVKIKEACSSLKKDWRDFAAKVAQHGFSYQMNPKTARQNVVERSYKALGEPIDPGLPLMEKLQKCFLSRYWGLPGWWNWVGREVLRSGTLTAASGQTREFLSRRPSNGKLDHSTLKEAIAFEPQAVTTWQTNRALHQIWHDTENWPSGVVSQGVPIVTVLLHTHDELSGSLPTTYKDWARPRLKEWGNNPITIGGTTIVIPAAGGFGPSWGECHEPL
jgi:hypothetical protein